MAVAAAANPIGTFEPRSSSAGLVRRQSVAVKSEKPAPAPAMPAKDQPAAPAAGANLSLEDLARSGVWEYLQSDDPMLEFVLPKNAKMEVFEIEPEPAEGDADDDVDDAQHGGAVDDAAMVCYVYCYFATTTRRRR